MVEHWTNQNLAPLATARSSANPIGGISLSHLVDVRDELALAWHVDLLVVGPHLALDGEEQHLQVALLCEPGTGAELNYVNYVNHVNHVNHVKYVKVN